MSDKKISQLTASTTPLAGTEILPIVQSGVTKKTTVESVLTSVQPSGTANGVLYMNGAKVATSGSALTFDGGNLGVGASSPVVRFHANAGGAQTTSINPTFDKFLFENSTGFNLVLGCGNDKSARISFNDTDARDRGAVYYDHSLNSLGFVANGFDRFRIDSTGNVTVNAGNLVIGTAGKGIDFSADGQAAGMTSELLDDYEEGTWTPVYSGLSGSIGSTAYAANGQLGRYTKIGNVVYVSARVVLSNKGSWTGAVLISGLPFAPLSSPNPNPAIGAIETRFVTFSEHLVTNFSASGVFIAEMVSGGQVTNLDASAVANNSGFIFTGFYIIN